MRNRCSYAGLVSAYFSVYLAGTKNVSTNTIYSYRDTFVIFHGYLEKYCGFKLEKMLFNDLSRELILEFLQYLETERKCSISSRNQRLAALKSFAKYVQIECPDEMILCQRILSIDSKKAAKPTVQYLSNQQTDILMEQPDISTPKGRRDLAMILLLYDSAARVQELCDLRICDIRIDSLPVVHLLGKGRKSRDVPLPIPDPVSDYERKQYPNLRDYINAEIIPEMQKKLRQGFGRAIRTEQDSCVVAVLDERAGIGGKYYEAVLAALPTCPTTEKIEDVQQFIREQKRPDYFL